MAGRRLPPGESGFRAITRRYKRGAASRGLAFSLSDARVREFLQTPCFYCSAAPMNQFKAKAKSAPFRYGGIDRLNNRRGYTEGNVVPCCFGCNKMKGTLGIAEFLERVQAVASNTFEVSA